MTVETLYIVQEDLFRVGNSSSPQLSKIRAGEITLMEINGVKVIVADGKGVSLYNKAGLERSSLTGWVWEIRAGLSLPKGLYLNPDPDRNNPGHYFACPRMNMPVHSYVGLLEEMALQCAKLYQRKKA